MRYLRRLVVATFVAGVMAQPASAQGVEISVAILPFGLLPTAGNSWRSGPTLGQQVVTIVSESGLYTVIDRSTDEAIETELRNAEGFRNFDSRVELGTTARLNASVLLIGAIEQQKIDVKRGTKPGERSSYTAEMGIRVKLVRTQTGELIKSAFFTVRNQSQASSALKEKGLGRFVPKIVQDEVAKKLDQTVADAAGRQKVDLTDRSEEDAIRGAAEMLKEPLSAFLQESFGAVVAASRSKKSD